MEGKMHLPDGVGVKRMTRAMDVAAKVSKRGRAGGVFWPPGGVTTLRWPHAPLTISMYVELCNWKQ